MIHLPWCGNILQWTVDTHQEMTGCPSLGPYLQEETGRSETMAIILQDNVIYRKKLHIFLFWGLMLSMQCREQR